MKLLLEQTPPADPLLRNFADIDNLFTGSWINAFDEASPSLNIVESDESFCITITAPNINKEDFSVCVENDIITISAARKTSTNTTCCSNAGENFVRSFHLPPTVQQHLINAFIKMKHSSSVYLELLR